MGFVPQLPDPDALLRARRAAERWLEPFLMGERGPDDVYAERMTTWHAATETETVITEPPSFARLRAAIPDLRREDIRVDLLADAILVQATTVGTVEGRDVRVAACLIARLDRDGRIHRFEEYADSTAAAPLRSALDGP